MNLNHDSKISKIGRDAPVTLLYMVTSLERKLLERYNISTFEGNNNNLHVIWLLNRFTEVTRETHSQLN